MYYGPVMIDLEGIELTEKERVLLKHPAVGGVILFSRNYNTLESIKAFVADIRREAKKPMLIAVDHEGGRVWRFKADFTRLPPAAHYGTLYCEASPEEALLLAYKNGAIMASELLACGIDFSLAPVLDLNRGISDVIGDRGFHADPHIVVALAKAFIEGMNSVGMQATGKHFPGHGGCSMDSHWAQAVDIRSWEALQEDILPFAKLASMLGGIMPAHVVYPSMDPLPAGYSKYWLQTILRNELQFKGAIISDCLSMKSADMGSDYVTRARMALDAGCNMVILCGQERDALQRVLDALDRAPSSENNEVLRSLAGKFTKKSNLS